MSKPLFPDDEARREAELRKRQQKSDRGTPGEWAIHGKRTDLAGGVGLRFRVGLDVAGTTIIGEKWAEDGTRTVVF